MTLLVMPTLSCNLRCAYCSWRYRPYEKPEYGDPDVLALEAIKTARETGHTEVVLHGGEPLLWPVNKLEKFLHNVTKAGLRVGMQTNATLITKKHIELFKRYGVNVGVSVDGDLEIGISRGFWRADGEPVSVEASRAVVKKVLDNIKAMREAGVGVGVIIVLSRLNFGDSEKIGKLANFIKSLKEVGIDSGRLNPAFNSPYELKWTELRDGYVELWHKIRDMNVWYTPYTDFTRALMGRRDTTCWFGGCGFFDTFVWTVLPNGKLTACDRVMWLDHYPLRTLDSPLIRSQIRTRALLQTELKNSLNGHLHRGGCPAESPDGDWRRASRFWRAWDELFEFMAGELLKLAPFLRLTNRYPDKLEFIEKIDSGCAWDLYNGGWVCRT